MLRCRGFAIRGHLSGIRKTINGESFGKYAQTVLTDEVNYLVGYLPHRFFGKKKCNFGDIFPKYFMETIKMTRALSEQKSVVTTHSLTRREMGDHGCISERNEIRIRSVKGMTK